MAIEARLQDFREEIADAPLFDRYTAKFNWRAEAQRVGMVLEYDYLYRLTSRLLHSTPMNIITEKEIIEAERTILMEYMVIGATDALDINRLVDVRSHFLSSRSPCSFSYELDPFFRVAVIHFHAIQTAITVKHRLPLPGGYRDRESGLHDETWQSKARKRRTGWALVWHFVACSEKSEKPPHSPSPSCPIDTPQSHERNKSTAPFTKSWAIAATS